MPSSELNFSLLEKIPPQNREAEMSVLGAMLMEESALVRAIEIIKPFWVGDK